MPRIVSAFLLLVIFAVPLFAESDQGHLSITGKISIYNPPGDADAAPMFNVDARYRLSSLISIVGSGGWCSYSAGDTDITYIPLSARGLLHMGRSGNIDPYVGAGLALNMKSFEFDNGDEETDTTGGAELLGGVTYRPAGGFGLDFDVIYRIEDLSDTSNSKSWSFGGGVRGTLDLNL